MSHPSAGHEVEPTGRRPPTQRRRVAGVIAQYIHELSERHNRAAEDLAGATRVDQPSRG